MKNFFRTAIPTDSLRQKIRKLMTEFHGGLWSGNLVREYVSFFKEKAPDKLLELVLQMEGSEVRIER